MSARRRSVRRQQERRERQAQRRGKLDGGSLKLILGVAGGAGFVLLLAVLLVRAGGSSPEATAASVDLAERNAGTTIQEIGGSVHTVLHSNAPLPEASRPSADPRPTLVWFSGTWCHFCERMAPFAHATAAEFNDQLRFVEKSVDHDREAASRFGIRGTPTFVLIDQHGRELRRFHYQPDATAFAAQIEVVLTAVSARR